MIEEDELSEPREKPRPKKTPTKNTIERVLIYRNGENTDIGNFHKSIIGEPFEQRLPQFVKEMYGGGDYRVDFRGGAKNSFAGGTSFSISDDEPNTENSRQVINVDADETDFDESEFNINGEIEARAELLNLRRENQEMKRAERERTESAQTSQNEILQIMRESQRQADKSFQQGREQGMEMMKMFLEFQQKPQQNNQESILDLLKGTLEVQRGVREMAEEHFSPNETGGGSSMIGDAAKLVDSLGRNAGTFLPMIGGLLGGGTPKAPIRANKPQNAPTSNGNGQSGGLSDLAKKVVQKKQEVKK